MKKNTLEKILKNNGFSTNKKDGYVEAVYGFRTIYLYLNILGNVSKIGTDFDIIGFINSYYKKKTKHTVSVFNRMKANNFNTDSAINELGWTIVRVCDLNEMHLFHQTEDLIAESMYEISIKGLSHIIIDETVFEGELGPLIEIAEVHPNEIIKTLIKTT